MAEFNASQFLQSQGLKLVGANDDGSLQVQGQDGKVGKFEPAKFLAAQGVNPAEIAIKANDPSTALPDSPVSTVDRVKLAFGNTKGSVDYLSKKFEGVQVDKNSGIVVQDKGVWKQVDPSLFKGDGWTLSEALKDTVEGVAGIGAQVAGQIAGATAGAAAGFAGGAAAGAAAGPVGSFATGVYGGIAGGIAGAGAGGALGEEVRTRLGRYVGTYKATDQEHMNDLAIEGLTSMVGEGLGVGMRPAWGWFKDAMGKLGKSASEGVKDLAANTWGKLSSVGPESMRTFIDNSAEVSANMVKYKAAGATTPEALIQLAGEAKMKAGKDLLEGATDALPQKYGELLGNLFKDAKAKDMRVNLGDVVSNAKQSIVDSGFGVLDKTGKLLPLSPKDLAARLAGGKDISTAAVDPKIFGQVRGLVDQLNAFSRVGELRGDAAAKALTSLNKTLNRAATQAGAGGADAELARALQQAVVGFKNGVGAQFEKAGLKEQYSGLAKLYGEYGDAVANARAILARGGEEAFANKLVSAAGKNLTAKGEASKLVELLGQKGQSLYKDIVVNHVTQKMAPVAPNLGFFQSLAHTGAIGGVLTNHPGVAAVSALTATQTSPRLIAAEVNMARKAIGMSSKAGQALQDYGDIMLSAMKRMTPEMAQEALKNPAIYGTGFSQLMNAMKGEQGMQSQLLQQAGVGPQNGQ